MSFEPRQEPESVDGMRVASIGGLSVVVAVASVIVAIGIERATTRHPWEYSDVTPLPLRGTVEHTLLAGPGRGELDVRAKRAELARWTWADRRTGVVQMPIERAIDLWVSRYGAPAASEPPPPRPVLLGPGEKAGVELGMVAPDGRHP